MVHEAQVNKLRDKIDLFTKSYGKELSKKVEKNSLLPILWLNYLNASQKTGIANELLDAFACSIRETAACTALGLVRPALFSMRTQIDLILAWLYFKDHHIEWEQVNVIGEGFKLKKELLEYLSNYYPGFGARHGILKQISTRKEEDSYRLLSAHIHGQSNPVLPVTVELSDVVRTKELSEQCAQVVGEVSEYVSDILYAVYASQWTAIPNEITKQVTERFASPAQKAKFFENL